ncbi:hypothetical protein ILUMI_24257 [Ignelater luminosus]|uniref:Uncharacterized protein n=1 Tax=Ignelater luminosus TaxID=2038154 RepID=A0A8K0CCB2_IGNLU|nr:hypothetical protein ILUMI_24257 [Ignelater luminosus]
MGSATAARNTSRRNRGALLSLNASSALTNAKRPAKSPPSAPNIEARTRLTTKNASGTPLLRGLGDSRDRPKVGLLCASCRETGTYWPCKPARERAVARHCRIVSDDASVPVNLYGLTGLSDQATTSDDAEPKPQTFLPWKELDHAKVEAFADKLKQQCLPNIGRINKTTNIANCRFREGSEANQGDPGQKSFRSRRHYQQGTQGSFEQSHRQQWKCVFSAKLQADQSFACDGQDCQKHRANLRQPIIEVIKSELNCWFLDNQTLGSVPETVLKDFYKIKELFSKMGLEINPEVKQNFYKGLCEPESGAWLNVLPLISSDTLQDNNSFKIAIGLRLGLNLNPTHTCVCGKTVLPNGHHGLSRKKVYGKISRHRRINEIIRAPLNTAGYPSTLELPGLSQTDNKRPDGMTHF